MWTEKLALYQKWQKKVNFWSLFKKKKKKKINKVCLHYNIE